MLGRKTWNIQIEVPYIRHEFFIFYFISFIFFKNTWLITQPFSDSHAEMLFWKSKHIIMLQRDSLDFFTGIVYQHM